jgi:acetolactate decarboxylase
MTKVSQGILFSLALFLVICGCGQGNRDTVFQSSPYARFASGSLDGETSLSFIARHGDFGIGTINGLDGEMLFIDGVFYDARVDGKVYRLSGSERTPFATVTFFEPDKTFDLPEENNYQALQRDLDVKLPSDDGIFAIKITGRFPSLKIRSVPRQVPPYKELAVVLKDQKVFQLKDIEGTMVGYRFPRFLDGANVAGYHFHFLSKDQSTGGHVLDCSISSCRVEIDETGNFTLQLK